MIIMGSKPNSFLLVNPFIPMDYYQFVKVISYYKTID